MTNLMVGASRRVLILLAWVAVGGCTGSDRAPLTRLDARDGADGGDADDDGADDDGAGDDGAAGPGDDADVNGDGAGDAAGDDAGDGEREDGDAVPDGEDPFQPVPRERCDDDDGDGDGRVGCDDPSCCRLARCLVTPACSAVATDPASIAPALPEDVPTGLFDRLSFLIAEQRADRAAFTPTRVIGVRGRVIDAAGDPVAGAVVYAPGRAAFEAWGAANTRSDGRFDFVAEGGGAFVLRIDKAGYLPVDRRLDLAWGAEMTLPDVVLTALDPVATVIALGPAAPAATHRAATVRDASGERTASLTFRAGTRATATLPDGTLMPLTSGTLRATEYSVGASGPRAMPAPLPASSAYTYCVELGFDEARALDAVTVELDPPAVFWVEDLIGAPVGSGVPTASYDRARFTWVPADRGRVVAVLAGGGIDLDGDGAAESDVDLAAAGIDPPERAVAAERAPGRYWRVEIPHFTPWDHNWPYGPPPDARDPELEPPESDDDQTDDDEDECRNGSVILPDARVLIERIPLPGTGQSLVWRSDRTPGFAAARRIDVPLSGPQIPASLRAIRWSIDVAGQHFAETVAPAPGLTRSFEWDGRDAYGRPVAGTSAALVTIEYAYPLTYIADLGTRLRSFGRPGLDVGRDAAGELIAITTSNRSEVSEVVTRQVDALVLTSPFRPDVTAAGLGGWTLSGVHSYDPLNAILFYGDGSQRRAARRGDRVDYAVDARAQVGIPYAFAVEPDGAILFPDVYGYRIARVDARGGVATVAGRPAPTSTDELLASRLEVGEDVPALETRVHMPRSLALTPPGQGGPAADGAPPSDERWFVYSGRHAIRAVSRAGIVTTIAGRRGEDLPPGSAPELTELGAFAGDGGPAREALLCEPDALTYLADGSLVFIDGGYRLPPFGGPIRLDSDGPNSRPCGTPRIRRIAPDGTIDTIAGTGVSVEDYTQAKGDGGPARDATFTELSSLAVAPDGRLCVADFGRVRCIWPDGHIDTLTGWFQTDFASRSEGPADEVSFGHFLTLAFDRGGALWISDGWTVSRLTPTSDVYADAGAGPASGRHWVARAIGAEYRVGLEPRIPGFALELELVARHVAIGPDDRPRFHRDVSSLTVAPFLRLVSPYATALPLGATVLSDGAGRLHRFTPEGRHTATLDPSATRELSRVEWGPDGVDAVVDTALLPLLTVERSGAGDVTAIVSGTGRRYAVTTSGGRLTSVDDGERTVALGYRDDGLLETKTTTPDAASPADPPTTTSWTWDALGRLASESADGVVRWRFDAAEAPRGARAWRETSAGGQTRSYLRTRDPGGTTARTTTRTTTAGDIARRVTTRGNERVKALPSGLVARYRHTAHPERGPDQRVLGRMSFTLGELRAAEVERSFTSDTADVTRATVSAGGDVWSSELDAAARSFVVTRPDGVATTVLWDAAGRVASRQVGRDPATTFDYDALGRVTAIRRGREAVRFDYAATSSAAAANPSAVWLGDDAVTLDWDDRGALASATRADGFTLAFHREGRRELIGFTADDATRVWSFDATSDGQPTTITAPDGSVFVDRSYTVDRQLSRVEHGAGAYAVDYGYDAGVPVTRTTGEGVIATTLVPGTDRAARIVHPAGVAIDVTWDGLLATNVRTTFEPGVVADFGRSFDASGHLESESLRASGATVAYPVARDAVGRLTTAGALGWTYDGEGHLASASVGVLRETWTRVEGRPASYRVVDESDDILYERVLGFDDDARLAETSERIGADAAVTRRFAYDSVGRLTRVSDAADTTVEAYGYDALERVDDGVRATFDARGALTAHGATAIEHDAAGVRRVDGDARLDYDDELALRRVTLPDRTIRYTVDGLGQRVARHVDGEPSATRYYVAHDHRLIAELDAAGAVRWRFLPGAEGHGAGLAVRDGITYRVVGDERGSVRALIAVASGEIALTRAYDAYGNITAEGGSQVAALGDFPLAFGGGLGDRDTGFVHFGVRDYDPRTGAWLQPEPLGFRAGQSPWAYAGHDPVNRVDPTGRAPSPPSPTLTDVLVDGVDRLLADLHYFHDDAVARASEVANRPEIKALGGNATDGLQHCIASCSIADHRDPFLSFVVGAAYEVVGTVGTAGLVVNALTAQAAGRDVPVPWDQLDDSIWDLANNADGYCAAAGGATRGEGCADACASAALGGRLELHRN